jgi:hypothetical protein
MLTSQTYDDSILSKLSFLKGKCKSPISKVAVSSVTDLLGTDLLMIPIIAT